MRLEITDSGTRILWKKTTEPIRCKLCGETTKDRSWFFCESGQFLMCEFCCRSKGCDESETQHAKTRRPEHTDWLIDVFKNVEDNDGGENNDNEMGA